jgi:hypothetical protein
MPVRWEEMAVRNSHDVEPVKNIHVVMIEAQSPMLAAQDAAICTGHTGRTP